MLTWNVGGVTIGLNACSGWLVEGDRRDGARIRQLTAEERGAMDDPFYFHHTVMRKVLMDLQEDWTAAGTRSEDHNVGAVTPGRRWERGWEGGQGRGFRGEGRTAGSREGASARVGEGEAAPSPPPLTHTTTADLPRSFPHQVPPSTASASIEAGRT